MRRREFITLISGAAAWPLAARAQQADRMRRIGVLSPFAADDPESMAVGRNVRIDYRRSAGDAEGTGSRTIGTVAASARDAR